MFFCGLQPEIDVFITLNVAAHVARLYLLQEIKLPADGGAPVLVGGDQTYQTNGLRPAA